MASTRRSGLATARRAAGYTQEGLAYDLGVDRSTVIRWEAGDRMPLPYLRPKLARLLRLSADRLTAVLEDGQSSIATTDQVTDALAWLDRRAGWQRGRAARVVARQKPSTQLDVHPPARSRVAEVLSRYYPADGASGERRYTAAVDGYALDTSVLTRSAWLDLRYSVGRDGSSLTLAPSSWAPPPLTTNQATAAMSRLAEINANDVRLTRVPVFRLTAVDFSAGYVGGLVESVPFVEYALTYDLLERELRQCLASDSSPMPLRDALLPDLSAVLDLQGRCCAGGVLALTAIARPASPHGAADYLILVQERSGHVMNAPGTLAVIPKAFHGPVMDHREDAHIGATLRRKLEGELFGRFDMDPSSGPIRAAAPMHPSRLSAPMRWLDQHPDRLLVECTGFGLNLVSGNYEFACLVVIQDEEFWPLFGGQIEANWEAAGLRAYSSLDRAFISKLTLDESWSNEGLFAFLQGIRRLGELGGRRVRLPAVEPSVR